MSEGPGAGRLVAGRYRLLGPLGEGGMGVVWRARDEVLGREVAVKEVRAPAGFGAADVRRLYTRLEREAWATARIAHRNVVTVHDVATEEGRPWIVMELVRGLTLAETLHAEGGMPPRRAAHIGAEVLAALRAAHEAGVLHRDVKPGNVLLGNDGRVVLTDFGIALVAGSPQLTMTGELVGSPEYLAPERAMGRPSGPAADLWSLGVLLYAAVEGGSPFRRDTALGTLRAVVDDPLPPPQRAGALAPVVERLLHKDPDERPSAEETARLLAAVGTGGTPRADTPPPTRPVGGAAPLPPDPDTPSSPVPYGSGGEGAGPGGPGGGGDRGRTVAVLVAGAVILVLVLGGLAYALLRDGDRDRDGGGTRAGGQAAEGPTPRGASPTANGNPTGTATGGSPTTVGAGTGTGAGTGSGTSSGTSSSLGMGGTGGTGGDGGGGGGTPDPSPQTVRVDVRPVRDAYRGACPPSAEHAPYFVATVAVGRTPASVDYRWATESGESSGPEWRTLHFGAGDRGRRLVGHTELTYRQGEAHEDRIRLEVRSPVHVHSAWVGFSVACDDESPTGGTTSGTTSGSASGETTGSGTSSGASPVRPPARRTAARPRSRPRRRAGDGSRSPNRSPTRRSAAPAGSRPTGPGRWGGTTPRC